MQGTIGEIRVFTSNYAPENWAICDGTFLEMDGNEALFSLIGTAYGGNGASNFGLPNLCGRAAVKIGAGTGLSPYAIGQKGGFEEIMLAPANLAPHTHTFTVCTSDSNANNPANNYLSAMVDIANPSNEIRAYLPNNPSDTDQALVPLNSDTIDAPPSDGEAHENRMPFMALTYIICTQGTYPDLQ